jgi:hypothetical protein
VPDKSFFVALDEMPVKRYTEFDTSNNPSWAQVVARNRDFFKSTCFKFGDHADAEIFKFMFAMQSPCVVVFSPAEQVEIYARCDAFNIEALDAASQDVSVKLKTDFSSFITADLLPSVPTSQISVLTGVFYAGGNVMASRGWWEQLHDILDTFPVVAPPKPTTAAPAWHEDIKNVKPWLKGQLQKEQSKAPKSWASGDDKAPTPDNTFSDADLDGLFAELTEARLDAADGIVVCIDFKVVVLGGLWTMVHMGVSHDAYQGKVARANSEASDFAVAYGFRNSARYNVDLYGEVGARVCASTWTSKVQFFFDLWKARGGGAYVFTDDDFGSWRPNADFLATVAGAKGRALVRVLALRDDRPVRT